MTKSSHPQDPFQIIDVAAGLVFRSHRLLITQRFLNAHLGGLWEFPGGKVEPGETFPECLSRELLEELRIEVSVGAEIEEITHRYPEKTVRLKFFRCHWLTGEPQPIGCHNLVWITRSQLADFQFPAADARLLRLLETNNYLWEDTEIVAPGD